MELCQTHIHSNYVYSPEKESSRIAFLFDKPPFNPMTASIINGPTKTTEALTDKLLEVKHAILIKIEIEIDAMVDVVRRFLYFSLFYEFSVQYAKYEAIE